MSDSVRKGGHWRDNSFLDMGAGSKNLETRYMICKNCKKLIVVNERTYGAICKGCKKYNSAGENQINLLTYEQIIESDIVNTELENQAPHIISEDMKRHMAFRAKQEQKAIDFRNEQIKKRNQPGYVPTYHGPIDSKTGKRTK